MNENSPAVSAWDTGLPVFGPLKDRLPGCQAGGDHLYRLYRNSGATVVIAAQVVQQG